ncbi:hypothetical protein [Sinomonas cellulolyticus]|uniref:Uncharacterized protein n=1 Tax=Sinomonas cellulolyticus TaxID=2801916 RepID=A0ABS1K3C4_9MICC|nr:MULTISPECIES: hypothetical protein [Sinomonas]MBL0706130.1 hypothetical protein [Sinomonas cellulolyticus]
MQITGIIRPSETREITVEAEDYQDGRPKLEEQIPDGWQLIQIKTS